ncbi:hypothetical protein B484DRAFT_68413 [Ochromonadaceae sp. CCMP2298]|nr:hypothetical protein B484DRAFT_68413 [Ochromonadaceae sp. CCMP2298]
MYTLYYCPVPLPCTYPPHTLYIYPVHTLYIHIPCTYSLLHTLCYYPMYTLYGTPTYPSYIPCTLYYRPSFVLVLLSL